MSTTSIPFCAESLYQEHHTWLFGLLRRRLGNTFDAADLAHEAFLRLIVRPRRFDSDEGARAYLSTVATGLCVDLWRRQNLERSYLESLALLPEPMQISAEQVALILETLREIDAMLGSLPWKARSAFLMSQIEGQTYADIAAELKVSERMVKKYMAQAVLQCALFEAGMHGMATTV